MRGNLKYKFEKKIKMNKEESEVFTRRLDMIIKYRNEKIECENMTIRDLYFDDPHNEELKEEINGLEFSEKFRIRYYEADIENIRLEKVMKNGGKVCTIGTNITKEDAENILLGDIEYLVFSEKPILREFYLKMMCMLIEPKAIIRFNRIHVKDKERDLEICVDSEISASLNEKEILSEALKTVPVSEDGSCTVTVNHKRKLPEAIEYLIRSKENEGGDFQNQQSRMIF